MKVKKDGELASTSNALTDMEMDNIIETVDVKIKEAMDNILDTNFIINPKKKGNDNLSCTFCKFRDICYRNEKDFIYLKDEDEEGEEDA